MTRNCNAAKEAVNMRLLTLLGAALLVVLWNTLALAQSEVPVGGQCRDFTPEDFAVSATPGLSQKCALFVSQTEAHVNTELRSDSVGRATAVVESSAQGVLTEVKLFCPTYAAGTITGVPRSSQSRVGDHCSVPYGNAWVFRVTPDIKGVTVRDPSPQGETVTISLVHKAAGVTPAEVALYAPPPPQPEALVSEDDRSRWDRESTKNGSLDFGLGLSIDHGDDPMRYSAVAKGRGDIKLDGDGIWNLIVGAQFMHTWRQEPVRMVPNLQVQNGHVDMMSTYFGALFGLSIQPLDDLMRIEGFISLGPWVAHHPTVPLSQQRDLQMVFGPSDTNVELGFGAGLDFGVYPLANSYGFGLELGVVSTLTDTPTYRTAAVQGTLTPDGAEIVPDAPDADGRLADWQLVVYPIRIQF